MKNKKLISHSKGARLGQHFLVAPAIAEKIAEAGNIAPGETVLEIGPGKGALTRALLKRGARVIAVEKDPSLVKFLQKSFADTIKEKKLEIREGDIRTMIHHSAIQPCKVIANIPYYITGELLRMLLTAKRQPSTIVFLMQKEVAERIVGNPKQRLGTQSKKESLLSLSVKAYGTPRYVATVRAGSFSPPPKVDSAILAIENISRKNFTTPIYGGGEKEKRLLEERFFELLHAGFGQKRKALLGNLRRKFGKKNYTHHMWMRLGLDENVRAEDVPLSAWLALAGKL